MENFGLYPVITEEFCNKRNSLEVLTEVIRAGVKIVQMREKNRPKAELISLAQSYRKITRDNDVIFILNDKIELALEVEADGVHLGQDDIACLEAKKIAPHLFIGVSTHNDFEIKKAICDKADYINIGPVFSTSTKKDLDYPPVGVDFLKNYTGKLPLPFSVMGGIKIENIPALLEAGVKNIALITEITQASDIYKKTKELIDLIKPYLI